MHTTAISVVYNSCRDLSTVQTDQKYCLTSQKITFTVYKQKLIGIKNVFKQFFNFLVQLQSVRNV